MSISGKRPDLLALDEALTQLAIDRPELARLVSLRFFAGLTMEQAAKALQVSLRTAERNWMYAKAWLDEVCGIASPLRERVDALLRRHEQANSFLETPAAEFSETILTDASGDNLAASLQAGPAPALGEESAVVIGSVKVWNVPDLESGRKSSCVWRRGSDGADLGTGNRSDAPCAQRAQNSRQRGSLEPRRAAAGIGRPRRYGAGLGRQPRIPLVGRSAVNELPFRFPDVSTLTLLRQNRKTGQPLPLVVTDINMPKMDGFVLVKPIRADDLYGAIDSAVPAP
jgi:CheY-like chemotaxis protein